MSRFHFTAAAIVTAAALLLIAHTGTDDERRAELSQLAPITSDERASAHRIADLYADTHGAGTPWPACAGEDDAGPCVWDASVRGNGAGRSYVTNATGVPVPITDAAARTLLAGGAL